MSRFEKCESENNCKSQQNNVFLASRIFSFRIFFFFLKGGLNWMIGADESRESYPTFEL